MKYLKPALIVSVMVIAYLVGTIVGHEAGRAQANDELRSQNQALVKQVRACQKVIDYDSQVLTSSSQLIDTLSNSLDSAYARDDAKMSETADNVALIGTHISDLKNAVTPVAQDCGQEVKGA